jgi:hypothetical protein
MKEEDAEIMPLEEEEIEAEEAVATIPNEEEEEAEVNTDLTEVVEAPIPIEPSMAGPTSTITGSIQIHLLISKSSSLATVATSLAMPNALVKSNFNLVKTQDKEDEPTKRPTLVMKWMAFLT